MSDSVRPHRQQPTRLRRPWDSPGKNTGMGCHFLLQCMTVKSESEVAQSCPTLSDPMDCSLSGSSVHGIFQARVLEWGAISDNSHGPCWVRECLSSWQPFLPERNPNSRMAKPQAEGGPGLSTPSVPVPGHRVYASLEAPSEPQLGLVRSLRA